MIVYDPRAISLEDLIARHFAGHSPSHRSAHKNQYNSGLWYQEGTKDVVDEGVKAYKAQHPSREVQTDIAPLMPFYLAEEYHQKYMDRKMLKGAATTLPEVVTCSGGVCAR